MRLGGGPPILASTRSAREQKAYSAPAAGHDRACSAYGYAVAVLPVVEPAPQSYHYRLCQTESRHKGFNPPSTKRFVAKMTRFADVPDVLRCRDAWSILGSPKGKRTQREPKNFPGEESADTMGGGWREEMMNGRRTPTAVTPALCRVHCATRHQPAAPAPPQVRPISNSVARQAHPIASSTPRRRSHLASVHRGPRNKSWVTMGGWRATA